SHPERQGDRRERRHRREQRLPLLSIGGGPEGVAREGSQGREGTGMPGQRSVLRRGDRRRAARAQCLGLRGAAALQDRDRWPGRLLAGRRSQLRKASAQRNRIVLLFHPRSGRRRKRLRFRDWREQPLTTRTGLAEPISLRRITVRAATTLRLSHAAGRWLGAGSLMIGSKVFLDDLRLTVADAPRGDGTSLALNMFRSYKRDLYLKFDVRPSNLLKRAVKSQVSDVLAELRLEILHVESAACEQPSLRAACWVVRQEIEMARRALALRRELPEDEVPVTRAGLARQDDKAPAMAFANRHESKGVASGVVTFV